MSSGRLPLAMLLFGVALHADAQVARVFVSVTGNDLNVCSDIATPCRTLGGGITQVDAQGEVIVIDSGSYAGGTITKSVKINVATGVVAFSGLPIVVNPGSSGTVVLRGLTLKAATPGSGTGITQQSGTLFVENTVVDGWYHGLVSESGAQRLFVKGSVFRNQDALGLQVKDGSTARIAIDASYFESNGNGVGLAGGISRVSNSVITGNVYGAETVWVGTEATFHRCEIFSNSVGLIAESSSVLRVAESTLTRNGTGLWNFSSGATVESFGNNVIRGNSGNVSGTITTVALQ
jgi:hypothetical protein